MNKARAVLDVLAAAMPEDLSAAGIAKRAAITPHDTGRTLSRLFTQKRVSKSKVLGSYTRYWMTKEQAARHLHGPKPPDDFAGKTLHVFPIDAAVRLRFLDDLKARPAFADCAVLAAIADDYRRTLAALTKEKS